MPVPLSLAGRLALLLSLLPLGACQQAYSRPPSTTSAGPPAAPAAPAPAQSAPTSPTPAAPLVRVRWSGAGSINDGPIFVAQELGFFREEGIDVDYLTSVSASETVPALANRQLEVGATASNPASFNAALRDTGVRMVADRGSTPPGFGWSAVLVRKDHVDTGRYRDVPDLRGMTIAMTPPINATANAVAIGLMLERAGLAMTDVDMTPMPFPDMIPALANRSVDAAMAGEPIVAAAVRQGVAVRVKGNDEIYPNQQIAAVGYGPRCSRISPTSPAASWWGTCAASERISAGDRTASGSWT